MKLINKVEIKYFRSVHSAKVIKCNDLNVLSGRNDVGKSNFIKALNLFFNGRTDWSEEFDFYENFSKKRLDTVRKESVKGRQFISIKIEFIRPDGYKKSLPKTFEVERNWYRDSEYYDQKDFFSTKRYAGKLPGTLSAAQTSLTKFLNKIHFEYVPAIKDRNYFQSLLIRMQNELLSNSIPEGSGLSKTALDLAENISESITELKSDFESATSVATSIRPPETVSALFQSFMVSTSTKYGDIPLKYRGDGLQARYIASALNFFANNQNKNFIWGFEEPEIALEFTHALNLAEDFVNTYSKNSQIFLTSHSPAFIALSKENVSRYRVYKEADSEDSEDSLITILDGSMRQNPSYKVLQEEIGLLELQKEVYEKYKAKLKELERTRQRINELEELINGSQVPLILTEGITDVAIIDIAKDKLSIPLDFTVRSCDNVQEEGRSNGGADILKKTIETIHPDDSRKVIAIFDNDSKGLGEFNKLSKNFSKFKKNELIKAHRNGHAYALLLPTPEFRNSSHQNLSIEFMFEDRVLQKNNDHGGGLIIEKEKVSLRVNSVQQDILSMLDEEMVAKLQENLPSRVVGGKKVFSEQIVPNLEEGDFIGFTELFDMIDSILSED